MKNEVVNTVKKNRIPWIDTAKFLCIIMVLFSHMEYVPSYLQAVFKPFFLTAFFFLTGCVFNSNRKFLKFLINRIRTLLLPALLFSIIYLLDFKSILKLDYSLASFLDDISVLLRQQRGQGDMLWFLYVSFIAEIPLYFLHKYVKDKRWFFIISLVLCEASIIFTKHFMTEVPYWYLHVVFVAMFFMVLGSLFISYESYLKKLTENPVFMWVAACVYIAVVFILLFKFNIFVNINEYDANQLIWFITVILGIYLCITIAKKIPVSKIVLYCGRNTLIFYLIHDRVRGVINAVLKKTPLWDIIFTNDATKTLSVVLICCVEIFVILLVAMFINKCVPFIVGRQYKKSNIIESR